MDICWKDGSAISFSADKGAAIIRANREGLLSLADILTTLADEPSGSHIHLDMYNSLENGSDEIIIEKSDAPEFTGKQEER